MLHAPALQYPNGCTTSNIHEKSENSMTTSKLSAQHMALRDFQIFIKGRLRTELLANSIAK
jgi:hypothetical protein